MVTAVGSGVLFALGLGLGGMTQPAKVMAFLDVTGNWDPSLAFFMVGAIAVHSIGLAILGRTRPGLVPTPSSGGDRVDLRIIGGATLFGIGWGASGYCPGPALANAFVGRPAAIVFILGMFLGMEVFAFARRSRTHLGDETGTPLGLLASRIPTRP